MTTLAEEMGGAVQVDSTDNGVVNPRLARVWTVTGTGEGHDLDIQFEGTLAPGGPYLFIFNDGAFDITVDGKDVLAGECLVLSWDGTSWRGYSRSYTGVTANIPSVVGLLVGGAGPAGPSATRLLNPTGGGTWFNRSSAPHGGYDSVLAVVGFKAYFMGNSNSGNGLKAAAYDAFVDTWAAVSDLSSQFAPGAGAGESGKVYLYGGGFLVVDPASLHVKARSYDPATDTHATLGAQTFMHYEAIAHGDGSGKVYVAGGYDYPSLSGAANSPSDRLDEHTVGSDTWATRAAMPSPGRRAQAGAWTDGDLHLVSGHSGSPTSPITDHDEYDPGTNTWASRAAWPITGRGKAAGMSSVGSGFAVAGGSTNGMLNGSGSASDVYEYDNGTDTWAAESSLTSVVDRVQHQGGGMATS